MGRCAILAFADVDDKKVAVAFYEITAVLDEGADSGAVLV